MGVISSMRKSAAVYVAAVCVLAVVATVGVYHYAPRASSGDALTVALLCALAMMAELLGFMISDAATLSVAFIPYLATVLIAPNWQALTAVVAVKALTEFFARTPVKALFNIAQHAVASALAILIYCGLGGASLLELRGQTLYQATIREGLPAFAAVTLGFAANTVLVTGILALNSKRPLRTVWRETFLPSTGFNVLAAPIVFLFSWFFVAFGPFAAAALWVPILGLRQVHKSKNDLERTNRELLELLVKSIEARDPYTSGHSRRVQKYSVIIARALGLREREVEQVGHAALLHDVGKIYEKYAPILAKPDKLTPDEWATMQEHPVDGANLIAMMSNLREIVPPVRHHHENWDGTGYPDGLAGERIPLAARIITFADTIDAMTTERPYRGSLGQEQVRAEIIRCRAKQFDPDITDQLLSSPMWNAIFTSPAREGTPRQGLRILPASERGRQRAGA